MSRQIRAAFAQPFFCTGLAVFAACFLAWSSTPVVAQVTFDWATVGNAGNAADGTGYGAVDYSYRISKHEVTNAQYTEFLNAVAATDTFSLYSTNMDADARGGIIRSGSSGSYTYSVKANMGDKPVNHVSFLDAMRFTNWLENGQGASDTEAGVYTIGNGRNETRAAGARYFIPSEDEWYKAAYHKNDGVTGNYWDYPTGSDTAPIVAMANANGDISNPGSNVANYLSGADWNGQDGNVTTVGSTTSRSPFGTFDQGGNVFEWNEAVIGSSFRGLRGGSWIGSSFYLAASSRLFDFPSLEGSFFGFRVASIAEPICAGDGTLIEGFGETGDYNATCGSDDSYWAAHGASLFFQISDPVVQFELTASAPAGFGGSTINVDIEASKQSDLANLNLRTLLFNFTTGSYVSLPGIMPLATADAVQDFALPGGSDPADFIEPGTNEVRLLLQIIQTSGLPNVRTQLDEVLFNFE